MIYVLDACAMIAWLRNEPGQMLLIRPSEISTRSVWPTRLTSAKFSMMLSAMLQKRTPKVF